MLISKPIKAIFFIINHVVAAHLPFHLGLYSKISQQKDTNRTVTPTKAETSSPILARNNSKKDSCSLCKLKCSGNRIISPNNCRKCLPCPPTMKPDPTWRLCISGVGDDEESQRKNKEYLQDEEDKKLETQKNDDLDKKDFEEQRKLNDAEQDERKANREKAQKNLEKETKYQEKKTQKKLEYDTKKEETKKDNAKRNKVRRMSRCLPLVAIAMGSVVAAVYAEEFFDEDFLESLEMLPLWPEGLEIDEWINEGADYLFEQDGFVEKWVNMGNDFDNRVDPEFDPQGAGFVWAGGTGVGKRDSSNHIPDKTNIRHTTSQERRKRNLHSVPLATSTALIVHSDHLEKRFWWFLIPIFTAAIRVGVAVGRAASQFGKLAKNTIKIKKGTGKTSRADQGAGASKISKMKNWNNCLLKKDPVV